MTATVPAGLRALLHDVVDYAGLFPPAALDMDAAVRRFAEHQAEEARWMLGRFVLPAARLDEFAEAASPYHRRRGATWRLSALVGPDTEADLVRVAQFNESATRGRMLIEAVEGKALTPAGIAQLGARVPRTLATFVELPASPDPAPLVEALRGARLYAKLRSGGVTADAFPPAAAVLAFLGACARAGVPCKLTAGLHHPLRGEYRLTYAADAACGTMYGFVNALVAALLLRDGVPAEQAERALVEADPAAFAVDEEGVRWREHAISAARVREGRRRLLVSFGSCSFAEPVAELQALGWLA